MMRGALAIGLISLGVMACEGDEVTTTDAPGGETGTPQECANALDGSTPEDGADGVYYRTNLRLELAVADENASVSLADADGNDVPGTSTVEDAIVIFDATDPLMPETEYTATLAYECGDEPTVTFTTGTTGNPTSVDPLNRSYDLDLTAGTFTSPPGIGAVIKQLIGGAGDFGLLLMADVVDEKKGAISFIGSAALADDRTQQDLCTTPFFVEATWESPHFSGSTPELDIEVAGFAVTIQGLEIAGDYSVDGSEIEIERFAGEIDTRELDVILGQETCALIAAFAECAPCSFEPSSVTCLDLAVENLSLPYVPEADPLVREPVCDK